MEVEIILKYYNRTNICDRCGKNLALGPGNPCREYNIDGNWTGKWTCFSCYDKEQTQQIKKQLAHRRTGNLTKPSLIFGDDCEELTCRWRGVENLNKQNDNFCNPIDHSIDPELGIIQTKGAKLKITRSNHGILEYEYKTWRTKFINEHYKKIDYLIFYCVNMDGTIVSRIYLFPIIELIKRRSITIYKDSPKVTWHEKYRVKNEETIKRINEFWKIINKF